MNFNTLPVELKIEIFNCLDFKSKIVLPRVCRAWKEICRTHVKLDNVKFNWHAIHKYHKIFNTIFSKFNRIQDLELNYAKGISWRMDQDTDTLKDSLKIDRTYLKNLKRLSIYCNCELYDIEPFLNANLKELYLINSHSITCESLKNIPKICSKLKALGCETQEMDDSTVMEIAKNCKDLIFLDIGQCIETSFDVMCNIWCELTNLEYLSLRYYSTNDTWENFTPILSNIVKHCKKIKVLNLALTDVSDDDLLLLKELPDLTSINIRCTEHIYSQGLINLSEMTKLTELCISCSVQYNENIEMITKNCTQLKLFDISHSDEIDDKTLEIIEQNSPQLESLNLYDCNYITTNGILKILNVMNLKILCIPELHTWFFSEKAFKNITHNEYRFKRNHYFNFYSQ